MTALFRPLLSPCWSLHHTDIIVRGRAKLSLGIVDMVQNRWLTPEALAEHLVRLNPSEAILDNLANPAIRAQAVEAARDPLMRFVRRPGNRGSGWCLRNQVVGLELGPMAHGWMPASPPGIPRHLNPIY